MTQYRKTFAQELSGIVVFLFEPDGSRAIPPAAVVKPLSLRHGAR
jgi:hypothetical protein